MSLDSLCRWQIQVSVYCAWRIPAHLRCTQYSILLHLMDICFLTCICLWQISQIQTPPLVGCVVWSHLVFGQPRIRMCVQGVQFVNLVVHLLSSIMTICPSHVHLDLFISSMISFTPVCILVDMAVFFPWDVDHYSFMGSLQCS